MVLVDTRSLPGVPNDLCFFLNLKGGAVQRGGETSKEKGLRDSERLVRGERLLVSVVLEFTDEKTVKSKFFEFSGRELMSCPESSVPSRT